MAKCSSPIDRRISEDAIIHGCRNIVEMDDETVQALAEGWVPEALCERMWRLLGLDREARRVQARAKADE
jgi:hypothetical protein